MLISLASEGACGRVLDDTVFASGFGLVTRMSSPKSLASGTQTQAPALSNENESEETSLLVFDVLLCFGIGTE